MSLKSLLTVGSNTRERRIFISLAGLECASSQPTSRCRVKGLSAQPAIADPLLGPEAGQHRRCRRLLELLPQKGDRDLQLAGQIHDGAATTGREVVVVEPETEAS